METYYLKYIFNMVRRGFVLLLILSGLCLLYFKLSLNMESPHLRPLHQMFGNMSLSSSSFKTIQRKEDSVHDVPSRTNSSQVINFSDDLKTVQNSHNSNSDSVSLTNLQETKNTNMIDYTVNNIKDLSKADTEATTVTLQATHITTSADKYELKLESGDNSNTTIKQSVNRISDLAKENKNSLAERKGSTHQSISELIKQKGELTNENLLDSVNEFKTEQKIYSSVDKPKDNNNPSVDELMLKNPSVNKQINNNPSADEQINNKPSADEQINNKPSADEQIGNSPSADKQINNNPSVDNLVGINPSADKRMDNSPPADKQLDIIPSAENNEKNPPAQSVAAKKLDSLSSKLAQRGLIQSPYKLKVSRNVPTEDLMKAGPFNFMTNYKNPCYWSPDAKRGPGSVPILCLPYFFLVGAPKSGTTDLNRRLVQHPQITGRLPKEPHWFTRKRFVSPLRTLRNYQEQFLSEATKQVFKTMDSKGYHNIVFGDCSASNLWDNYRLGQKQRNVSSDIMITNADVIHHLYPKTKIIIMVRDPVERLYSDYMYFSHGTPQHFHDKVLIGIQTAKNCLKKLTVRQCLYTHVHEAFTGVRIHIGIYYQHIMEYLRVFPRDQVMIIKLEDFSSRSEEYMKNLFKFLELEPLNKETLHRIANPQRKANTRKRTDKIVGDMLPETRKLLRQFYKPFNAKLVELLGEKFNYNV